MSSVPSQDPAIAGSALPDTHEGVVRGLADAMFRGALWYVIGTALLGVLVSGVLVGPRGVLGAVVGGVVACGSSLATLWLMRRTAALEVHFVMAAALGGFIGKMIILLVVMTLLRGVPMLHPKALAFTMLAVVLVAAATEARVFQKYRAPAVIPDVQKPVES